MPGRLKKADKNDLPLIMAIESASYSNPWTKRHVAMAIENNEVWLANNDGFIIYEFIPPECELSIIAVHPRAQRHGIGFELLNKMVEHCTAKAIEKIFLEVEESNIAAIALYQKLGFTQFSQRKDYYGPYRHAVLMQLQLPQKPSN